MTQPYVDIQEILEEEKDKLSQIMFLLIQRDGNSDLNPTEVLLPPYISRKALIGFCHYQHLCHSAHVPDYLLVSSLPCTAIDHRAAGCRGRIGLGIELGSGSDIHSSFFTLHSVSPSGHHLSWVGSLHSGIMQPSFLGNLHPHWSCLYCVVTVFINIYY